MSDELKSIFCIKGEVPLICRNPEFDEFEDETEVIILLLRYFKTYLPPLMEKKKDARERPIKIDPRDIGVTTQKDTGDYIVVLVPTDDNSIYSDDNFMRENTEYIFQVQLEVREMDSEACLENLIKLKSGIKTMLVNMSKNLGLNVVVGPYNHEGPFTIEGINKIIRQGTYIFSILDYKFKNACQEKN